MSSFQIGDEVALPQGHRAILRWIGRIPGKSPIEYAGVEVIGAAATRLGKHSGCHDGVQYFKTEVPNTGLFVTFTQLVSANIKTPRLTGTGSNPGSPGYAKATVFRSPGLKSPTRDQANQSPLMVRSPAPAGLQVKVNENARARTPAEISPFDGAPALQLQLEKMREQRELERTNHEKQRAEYRQTLLSMNEKVEDLKTKFALKIEELKADYETKLRNARRTSSLMIQPGGSEVEEQRLALANMQNKLIAERSEKQDQIDRLTRELDNVRKLLGSTEDLETLAGDLAKSEQQLKELRSQLDEVENLKAEIAELRARNSELELLAHSASSAGSRGSLQSSSSAASAGDEIERLERALEARRAHEAELEAQNALLRQEVEQLRTRLAARESSLKELERPQRVPSVPATRSLASMEESDSSTFVDITAGREDWCSLCEREGHSSEQCPFD